jgi:hypothetical protein
MNNRDRANDSQHREGFPHHHHHLHLTVFNKDNLEVNLQTLMKNNNLFRKIAIGTPEEVTKNLRDDNSVIIDPLNKITGTQEIDLHRERQANQDREEIKIHKIKGRTVVHLIETTRTTMMNQTDISDNTLTEIAIIDSMVTEIET